MTDILYQESFSDNVISNNILPVLDNPVNSITLEKQFSLSEVRT